MCLLRTILRCLAPGAAIEHRILRSEIGDAIGHASHPTAGILRLRYTSRTMAACGGPVAPWEGELVDLIYRQSGCRRRNSSLRLHHSEMPRHVAPCQSTSASEMGLVRLSVCVGGRRVWVCSRVLSHGCQPVGSGGAGGIRTINRPGHDFNQEESPRKHKDNGTNEGAGNQCQCEGRCLQDFGSYLALGNQRGVVLDPS